MVFARERSSIAGGESFGRVQQSDSDGRCGDLRGRSEKSAFTQLFARTLQRKAGEGRARVSPYVWGVDEGGRRLRNPAPSGTPTTSSRPEQAKESDLRVCRYLPIFLSSPSVSL